MRYENYVIHNEGDLLALKKMFNCDDLEKLSTMYHQQTGREVIDLREDSIYTNVDAQDDPYFWSEESIN